MEGKPWKGILSFTMPVMLGLLLQYLYNTVDTIIVGNFTGELSLSAVGTTTCIGMIFQAISGGFSVGAGIVIAQLFGAKRFKEMRENASTAIVMSAGLGVLSLVIGCAFCRPFLAGPLGVSGEMLDMAVVYFRAFCVGILFQFGYDIAASILRGVGDSKASLYFLLISSIINVVLDLLFVGTFHMGVLGAGVATAIAQCASAAAGFVYMYKRYDDFNFGIRDLRFNPALVGGILKEGVPVIMQRLLITLAQIFMQRLVNSYGVAMTAAYSVGQKLENYIELFTVSMSTTMATYAGQNFGAGRKDRLRLGVRQSIALSLGGTAILAAAGYILAHNVVQWFGLSDQAAVYCTAFFRTLCLATVVLSSYCPMQGFFQGVGHGFTATLVASIAQGTRVIAAYIMRTIPSINYSAIWLNFYVGFSLASCMAWIRFAQISRQWRKEERETGK